MSLLYDILRETFNTLLVASPFILLGLVLAGFLHMLMKASTVERWLGRPGLAGAVRAAAIGVPLPVCSCGVVPIAVEMRRKGASSPSSMSFLITTPESSLDSIFLTWGLMGPVMAIARPIAAFFTALISGVLSIAYLHDAPPETPENAEDDGEGCGDHCGCDPHEHALESPGSAEARAALAAFGARIRRFFLRKSAPPPADAPPVGRALVRPALRYGMVELLDDLAFWLLVGIVAAGVLGALVPDDLARYGLGVGLLPMLLVLAAGVPIYMCASASTPVAAALMAKGISPGAALVFLLAGPATNAATVVLLDRTFGRRFVKIYLVAVVVGALASGLALDAFAGLFDWQLATALGENSSGYMRAVEWISAVVLSVFMAWRLWAVAWKSGVAELRAGFQSFLPAAPAGRRSVAVLAVAALILLYLASGLVSVPLDSRGWVFVFGRLSGELSPGLHWTPPSPFGDVEIQASERARKADVGFRTDLEMLSQRRELTRWAPEDEWHSPVAAMNAKPEKTSYLSADENLLEISFTVHYGLDDPTAFYYRLDHREDLVALYAENAARRYVATHLLEDLLTGHRDLEQAIRDGLEVSLASLELGIRVESVHVVDIHPPGAAVYAFRDVSSAREERETRIHRSREILARQVPKARGEGEAVVVEATARAAARTTEAAARAEAFSAEAGAVATAPRILRHLLRVENAEKILPGRQKFIVPPGSEATGVTLWREEPPDTEKP